MPTKDIQGLYISTGTMIKFFALILMIWAIYILRDVFTSLFFAIIIASAIEPAIVWLKERKAPRILSVILIFLAIAAVFLFIVYLIFPLLLEEVRNIYLTYPAIQQQVRSGLERVEILPFTSVLSEGLEGFLRLPGEYLGKLGSGVFNFVSAAFGGIFSFFLVVIFSLYLAAQEKGIENFLRLISPISYEPYIIDLWQRSQKKLGHWLRAQMLLGAIVGVLIFFGLTLLGVKHALFFAFLASIFEIIPVVGPILAAVPAVATAFLGAPLLGIFTVLLYVVVQQVESHVIVPVVMRRAVGLSPLVVVLALLVGAKLGGIFGILLAVPITAILAEFINDWDRKKRALMPE